MSSQSGVDNGQQEEAVREDLSGWDGIPCSFVEILLEIHASVSLQMHKECSVTELPFLHLELTEALIVRLFFLPLPRNRFLMNTFKFESLLTKNPSLTEEIRILSC